MKKTTIFEDRTYVAPEAEEILTETAPIMDGTQLEDPGSQADE